jgi:hypothetical protein
MGGFWSLVVLLLLYLPLSLVLGVYLGSYRGRWLLGGFLGLLYGPIGLVIVLLTPEAPEAEAAPRKPRASARKPWESSEYPQGLPE